MEVTYTGPSHLFHREFWDAVFGEDIKEIGRAHQHSKIAVCRSGNIVLPDYLYCYWGVTLLGDPTVKIKDINGPNNSPNEPTCSYDKDSREIVVSTIDIDGDQVKFGVSWENDKIVDEWTGFVDSDEEVRIGCEGHTEILGMVGIIAKDEKDATSGWATVKNVKSLVFPISLRFLERFPNVLLILRRLLTM
jgi:hypothetical protein